ncbi:hypothetical protein H2199_001952 [Coniosporium tulheliwenetii]|uniref:Uncharacterized protein n=1 Tax=Coniosporium tulheliwenetii TaxID=3383036 RepID=A0ACC2ZL31_9PEZI|nr:hypothetical protein H2199_001952 [Cladosporium sp. JES 115]
MALAFLCSRLNREEAGILKPTAFVVDHKLRRGSTTEADGVVQQLQKLGIPALRLDLEWPQGVNPLELPNLETEARKLRFRALGAACRQQKLKALLLAHHRDDQAETVLTRLFAGRAGTGLRGIRPIADIPECYGMHRVYRSGQSISVPEHFLPKTTWLQAASLRMESGGIKVKRPLGSFSKDRLIATCAHWEVPWVEDESNSDRTLTVRNAVRHVFKSHRLPVALTKTSICSLSDRVAARVVARQTLADKLFEECQLEVNTRSGTVAVRFPERVSELSGHSKGLTIAAMLVRRAVELVSPEPEVSLQQLELPVLQIFPDLFREDSHPAGNKSLQRFTAAGVMFSHRYRSWKGHAPGEWWLLSRQMPNRGLAFPAVKVDPSLPRRHQPFRLFDGRFWIRIRSPSTRSLTVRMSGPEELGKFLQSLGSTVANRLSAVLRKEAPGGIRYTLPMLVAENEDGSIEPVALPTLGFKVDGPQADREWASLAWDFRYRKMHLPHPPEADGSMENKSVFTSSLDIERTAQHHMQHL